VYSLKSYCHYLLYLFSISSAKHLCVTAGVSIKDRSIYRPTLPST